MDDCTTVLNINETCRTCMTSTAEEHLKSISEIKVVEILQKFDIDLILNDEFPSNICNICINQLNQFSMFLQKCKSTEEELHSIIAAKRDEILIIELDEEYDDKNEQSSIANEEEFFAIRPIHSLEKGPPYDCNVCGKSFNNFHEIKMHRNAEKHWRKHKYVCPVCDDGKLYSYQCCVVHLRTHKDEKPYKCEYCDRGFRTNFNKKQHLRTHTGERPHICESCGKGFAVLFSLKKHVCLNPETERIYTCKFCSDHFKNYTLYLRHLKGHKTDSHIKYYKCDQCDKKFAKKSVLITHKAIHAEKRFLCNTCGEEFHYKGSLKSHIRTHDGERPHACDLCDKTFTLQSTLIQHKRVHSGERPFKCETCGKSFKQAAHLRTHKKLHGGEKAFKCTYCEKQFLLKGTLTVHMRIHTGDTPYICDICNKGFYDSTNMKTHRKRHRV